MARTTRSETARRSRTSARTNRGVYVDGNTVRRLAEVPERKRQPGRQNPGRQQTNRNRRVQASPAQVPRQKHQLSKEAQKNRQKATAMNWRLGMKYPSDDQTVTYSTSGNSYVRQYQDIPDSK